MNVLLRNSNSFKAKTKSQSQFSYYQPFSYPQIKPIIYTQQLCPILTNNRRVITNFPQINNQKSNNSSSFALLSRRYSHSTSTSSPQPLSENVTEGKENIVEVEIKDEVEVEENEVEKQQKEEGGEAEAATEVIEETREMRIRGDKMMIYALIEEGNPEKAFELFKEFQKTMEQFEKEDAETLAKATALSPSSSSLNGIQQTNVESNNEEKSGNNSSPLLSTPSPLPIPTITPPPLSSPSPSQLPSSLSSNENIHFNSQNSSEFNQKPKRKHGQRKSTRIHSSLIDGLLKKKDTDVFNMIFDLLEGICRLTKRGPSPRIIHNVVEGAIHQKRPKYIVSLFKLVQKYKIHAHQLWSSQLPMSYSRRQAIDKVIPSSVDPIPCLKFPPSYKLNEEGELFLLDENNQPIIEQSADQSSTVNINGIDYDSDLYQKQIKNETKCIEERAFDYRQTIDTVKKLGRSAALPTSKQMILDWFEPLAQAIKHEQELCMEEDSSSASSRSAYAEQIVCIDSDRLSVITIHQLLVNKEVEKQTGMLLPQPTGIKYTQAALAIGEAVEEEHVQDQIKEVVPKSHLKHINKLPKRMYEKVSRLHVDINWPKSSQVALGGTLIKLLLESATVAVTTSRGEPERRPAFSHQYKYEKSKTYGAITMNEELLKQIDFVHSLRETFQPKLLPMVVPPMPWQTPHNGGYLRARTIVMRAQSKHQINNLSIHSEDVRQIYDLLDTLGSVPWRINKEIYEVMEEGWRRGGGLPYLPTKENYKYPKLPPDYRTSAESRKLWRKERKKIAQMNSELHSLRCDLVLKLDTAKHVLNEERIYFPHNIDFRGRSYPIPPHLNHIGSDLARSLLLFADGQPLGERGLRWLKIHLANVYGNNKISFDDRVKFVDAHIEEIKDSARDPLDGNRWWLQAEDHWQCLATCKQLSKALELDDPTKYVCNLPVHMDGSCNGLQHYAALGGDVDGGRSVNLLPADKPQDVYSEVLKIVVKRVETDALAGDPMALKLHGKLSRKTIKQTVMTSVYGVTYIGARKQIENAMWDQSTVTEEDLFGASKYIAKVTFEAMSNMFGGAREIMDWLKESARVVARANEVMSWSTPLKLPVLQHYRRPGKLTVKTQLQSVILVMDMDDLPVLIQKQRTAFPPNYVHSLDSTHMFYTTRMCKEAGITFAAVHDSYWTHPNTVDVMNVMLRDAFVKLHSEPLLEELRSQLKAKFPHLNFKPIPIRGPLDIFKVKESTYFFH